jgi:thioredoxin 1
VKLLKPLSVAALILGWLPAAFGQGGSAFAPFDRWTSAVLAGNSAALAAMYTTSPITQVQTPEGKTPGASAEVAFWTLWYARGIEDFQPKILSISRPQPGEVALVLRIEFETKLNSTMQPFTVEAAQVWVQQGNDWRIAMTQRSGLDPSPTFRLPEPAKPNTALYPPPGDAQKEINSALTAAAKDRKRVILVFGANWCYDCHVLDATFRSKQFAATVAANYHVVHINVGDDGDQNLDLAEHFGVPLKGHVRVPSLAVLDPDGKVVYAQKNGEFDDSVKLAPSDITAFLKKWAPAHQG